MIPSRGALRALPHHSAMRRLPTTQSIRRIDPCLAACHMSTLQKHRPLSRPAPMVSAARTLSLWPFRSSKPAETLAQDPVPSQPPAEAAPSEAASTPASTLTSTPESTLASASSENSELAAILSETVANKSSSPDSPAITDSILDMPEHIGYLSALGIDFGWGPSSTITWVVEHLHVYSGMPWWGTIVATAFLVRALLAPLSVRQSEAMRRMSVLAEDPQYKALSGRMMAMVREKTAMDQQAEFQTVRKMATELKKEAGVRITDMWIPMLVQVPIGFAMWRLLRTMADIPVPGLETGGLLWFTDLAVADPMYILPMVNPALVYFMNRANAAFQTEAQITQGKRMFYIMGPISFFFTLWMPAGLQLYFISTFFLTAMQTYALRNASIRNMIGLPPWVRPVRAAPAAPEGPGGDIVYQPPRGASSSSEAPAPAPPAKKAPIGDRFVKAVTESVPWAPSAEQKKQDEKERRLREQDEEEKRLEELQRERRRREFEDRFS